MIGTFLVGCAAYLLVYLVVLHVLAWYGGLAILTGAIRRKPKTRAARRKRPPARPKPAARRTHDAAR